ncbi:MAG TPA: PqqD family protein [Gemmatimonadaceae bacterium]|nr:PqqD family protein [Gemmatimonadaceae bacterium]
MTTAGTLSLAATVVASPEHISCDVADEVVLLSVTTGEYYSMNAVAADVWHRVQQPRRLSELRDELLEEYADVSAEQCERELLQLMVELLRYGFVDLADGERG